MSAEIYVKFSYEFYFEKGDDLITRLFVREVTDEFSAVTYAFDWLRVYEEKYGKCYAIKVYETEHEHNVLCWVEKDFRIF